MNLVDLWWLDQIKLQRQVSIMKMTDYVSILKETIDLHGDVEVESRSSCRGWSPTIYEAGSPGLGHPKSKWSSE